ncbi:MAG TPA: glycosyltransferase family 4 protein [Gemmatimonadota bacterium]|nr:glycosyltransferase family 4 protein [Gemmatimonadota bacterium]
MSRPLSILHCDFRLSWAGGQNQLWLLASGLRERGHRQWIATRPDSEMARRARKAGFAVVEHPYRGEVDPRAYLSLRRAIAVHRPDVVHAHDSHSLMPAAVAARLVRPRPAVVGHRRVDFPIRGHALSRWKYARGPDRLIAISRRVRDVLLEDGVPPERIALIPSGIALDTPPPPEGPSLRTRLGAPDGAPIVLTIATLADYKDHPTLVEAAARLRPRDPMTRWAVCGAGGLLEEIRADVARRGLAERVRYLGYVAGARGLLPEADVFCLSSKTEGLGTSVLDAMAAGVPVAAAAGGGIPEMIEHEVTGLLAPVGDGAALAAAVDRLLDDRPLASRFADAARERVREFDVERTIDRTVALYRELVGLRG